MEEATVYILYIYTTLDINYNIIYLYFLIIESQNLSTTLASFLIRTLRHSDVAFLGAFLWLISGVGAIKTFKRCLRKRLYIK